MKLRCWLGLHNWSSWGEVVHELWRGEVFLVGCVEFVMHIQTRRCQDCRKLDSRIVGEGPSSGVQYKRRIGKINEIKAREGS